MFRPSGRSHLPPILRLIGDTLYTRLKVTHGGETNGSDGMRVELEERGRGGGPRAGEEVEEIYDRPSVRPRARARAFPRSRLVSPEFFCLAPATDGLSGSRSSGDPTGRTLSPPFPPLEIYASRAPPRRDPFFFSLRHSTRNVNGGRRRAVYGTSCTRDVTSFVLFLV